MRSWIARANIEHFRKLLETDTDARKRAVIARLLTEEQTKLAAIEAAQRKAKA